MDNKIIMSFLGENKELVGRAFCFAGLALAPFCTLFARHYSRTLYFSQFLYALSLTFMASVGVTISTFMPYSSLDFMPQFASKFCSAGEFACVAAKLVSVAIVWLGAAAFFLLLIKIVACKKREAKFLSFYNFYKGLMYWFFGPLIYAATYTIIPLIQAGTFNKNFIGAAIVIVGFVILGITELIAYKVAQRAEENVWRKWIEFFSHWMVGGTLALMAVYIQISSISTIMKYLIPNLFTGLFSLIYLIKYKFAGKVLQRIVVIIQDGIIIAMMNLFIWKSDFVFTNQIDFYAIAIVFVLEVLVITIKFVQFCRSKGEDGDDSVVAPEKDDRGDNKERKLGNSFSNSIDNINPEYSYDGLKSSQIVSPKRAPPRRR